jgi:hypothetical protein
MIRCGYCGHLFAEEEGVRGCGGCGSPAACSMVRCPRCNYENPLEPALLKRLRKLFATKNQGDGT